jgi:hypothetical protein
LDRRGRLAVDLQLAGGLELDLQGCGEARSRPLGATTFAARPGAFVRQLRSRSRERPIAHHLRNLPRPRRVLVVALVGKATPGCFNI